ncbi:MAG TPA: Vms1/Ankzf1 family peptidyl-tRNA hydrolase [Trebonia sp.]|nr:Vms1/Ankzf1 family peptidyl-tRNA hydrolase [Trebonia sp.]
MDLGFLRPLYENPPDWPASGYVSVYLDTTPKENAPNEVALRLRAAREALAAAGADQATLDAVLAANLDHVSARSHALFAAGGLVRLHGIMPESPSRGESSSYTPLPHVVPWLAQRPPRLPHVRVSANREGGQVLAVPGAWPETQGDLETAMLGLTEVTGESWPVHKPSGGGWSQPRFQRSAEETWTETAKQIAGAVTAAADRVKAVFVVLGGDIREREILAGELPKALRGNLVMVDREVELTAPAFDEAAWAEESWRAALDVGARLDELRAQLDRPPGERRAVQGLDGTLTALRDGLVSDVLIADPAWQATAWIGPGMADVATERDQLAGRGVIDPVTDLASEALARAAAGTGAELHFLEPEAAETGWVAALLRAPAAAVEPAT